jgi:hypothetical protein
MKQSTRISDLKKVLAIGEAATPESSGGWTDQEINASAIALALFIAREMEKKSA